MELVESVYRLSAALPPEESYGLKSQIRQARASTKEFLNHLSIAQASLAEVETQLEISVRLKYLPAGEVDPSRAAIQKLGKQLHALRNALEARK
jgi:four helix bundle protein